MIHRLAMLVFLVSTIGFVALVFWGTRECATKAGCTPCSHKVILTERRGGPE